MFFYRRPFWGVGAKILMIFLLIAGGSLVARSAFQAGLIQGASVEGGELVGPYFYPHAKGHYFHPFGGSFLTFLAIFLGGILLIKLITSIVGLIMFKRWKTEMGPEWEDWHARKYHHHFYGPCHPGPWGPYPFSAMKIKGEEKSKDETPPDQTDES
jgi:hypothetical protein